MRPPNADVDLDLRVDGSGAICAAILNELPHWFGIPESNKETAAVADREPTIVASIDGEPVGILTTIRHAKSASEIYVMAVVPALHRHGIGAAMLAFAEEWLAEDGVRFLQVKTLADADPDPDPGYAKTRAFYRSCGFEPLEIFQTLWDPRNPALQMIKTIVD